MTDFKELILYLMIPTWIVILIVGLGLTVWKAKMIYQEHEVKIAQMKGQCVK